VYSARGVASAPGVPGSPLSLGRSRQGRVVVVATSWRLRPSSSLDASWRCSHSASATAPASAASSCSSPQLRPQPRELRRHALPLTLQPRHVPATMWCTGGITPEECLWPVPKPRACNIVSQGRAGAHQENTMLCSGAMELFSTCFLASSCSRQRHHLLY